MPVYRSLPDQGRILKAVFVTVLVMGLALFLPAMLGLVFAVFLPLPILVFRTRLGRAGGLIVLAGATVVLAVITSRLGPGPDAVMCLAFFVAGFVMAESMEQGLGVNKTVGYAVAAALATAGSALVVYSSSQATGVVTLVTEFLGRAIQIMFEAYRQAGALEQGAEFPAERAREVVYVWVRVLPALLAAAGLFVVWINLLACRRILPAAAGLTPDMGALNRWKAPEPLVWVAIAAAVTVVAPVGGWRFVGANALIVLMTLYLFQGLAVIAFYLEQKKVPPLYRAMIYILVLAGSQILLILVVGLGFFDLWGDFRRLNKKAQTG